MLFTHGSDLILFSNPALSRPWRQSLCGDVGRRYLRQESLVFPGDPGPDHGYPTTAADRPGFRPQFSLTLISKERRVKIHSKRESFSVLPDLGSSNGKNGGRHIGQPKHGPRLYGAERVSDAVRDGHSADDPFIASLLDEKLNFTRASGRKDMFPE
jgi:hypothetical protein